MQALASWLFNTGPTFEAFAFEARKTGEDERIVFDGSLTHMSKDEEVTPDVHNRTWRAFVAAVENAFSDEKIQEICARYNQIQWEDLKTSTAAFEKRYIEYFGVGAGCIHMDDLQKALDEESWFFSGDIQNRPPEEIRKYWRKATAFQYLESFEDPKKMDGAPKTQNQDTFDRDKQRLNLLFGIEDLISTQPNIPPLHPYYSRLEMAVICLLDVQDKGVVIPGPQGGYQVYDVISSNGLTAFALKPVTKCSHLKPLIAFRCTNQAVTQTNAFLSLLNDFELQIGLTGYQACKDQLRKLLEDTEFTGENKPVLLGYSLGGGHASYCFSDFLEKIDELVLFNSVGVDENVVKAAAAKMNALDPKIVPPAIYQHRNVCNLEGTEGDWVNKVGGKHMGWGIRHPNARIQVHEWQIHDHPAPGPNPYNPEDVIKSFNIHALRPLDSGGYQSRIHRGPTACDPILNTYQRDCALEDARKDFSNMYFRMLNELYQLIDLVFRVIGIDFFKKHG